MDAILLCYCLCSKYDTLGCEATDHLGRLSELLFDFALRLRGLIFPFVQGANCGVVVSVGKKWWPCTVAAEAEVSEVGAV